MSVERQQGTAYQTEAVRHGAPGKAEPDLVRARSRKRSRRPPSHEPCRRRSHTLWSDIKETAVVR